MSATKDLEAVWLFSSSSDPDKKYQTILFTTGETSCDCPGWRYMRKGVRTCKHVRLVEMGCATQSADNFVSYAKPGKEICRPSSVSRKINKVEAGLSGRVFAEEGAL